MAKKALESKKKEVLTKLNEQIGHQAVSVDTIQQVAMDWMAIADADGSGGVDFAELATGLSILCGGTSDQKAEAAFSLYDYNGDGYISMEEMIRYLRMHHSSFGHVVSFLLWFFIVFLFIE